MINPDIQVMLNSSNYANGIILESAGNILFDLALDQIKYPDVKLYTYYALLDGESLCIIVKLKWNGSSQPETHTGLGYWL